MYIVLYCCSYFCCNNLNKKRFFSFFLFFYIYIYIAYIISTSIVVAYKLKFIVYLQ